MFYCFLLSNLYALINSPIPLFPTLVYPLSIRLSSISSPFFQLLSVSPTRFTPYPVSFPIPFPPFCLVCLYSPILPLLSNILPFLVSHFSHLPRPYSPLPPIPSPYPLPVSQIRAQCVLYITRHMVGTP